MENTDRKEIPKNSKCRDLLKNFLSLVIPDVSTRCINSFISPAVLPLMLHPVLQRSHRLNLWFLIRTRPATTGLADKSIETMEKEHFWKIAFLQPSL